MRGRLATIAGAAALASGSACAMSSAEPSSAACRVINGEKLPAESGGADALCRAIAAAIADQAPNVGYTVEVKVLAQSRLSASVTTEDGREIAEQRFARMDGPLSASAFERFARTIASELAKAGKKD
jgi:hypothetical protein